MTDLHDAERRAVATVVLDLDGTLVDSNYEHVRAWKRAFQRVGVEIPAVELHRAIGMGGEKLVAAVAGDAVERAVGDDVRALHDTLFAELLPEVRALPGASDLIRRLDEVGSRPVLATSSNRDQVHRLLDLLSDAHRLRHVITGDDARSSKPAPDVVQLALEAAGPGSAVLVGDSVWDVQSAARAGIPCLGLRSGGVCPEALADAGAVHILAGPQELAEQLPTVLAALEAGETHHTQGKEAGP